MSQISIPILAIFVTLLRRESRIEERQVSVGRETQTRRVRVQDTVRTESGWTRHTLDQALVGANTIWRPARIDFRLQGTSTREYETPGDGPATVNDQTYQFLINQVTGTSGCITILPVNRFARYDLGGQASRGTCIMPSNLQAHDRGRIFAHEFGHLLGLPHIGENGTQLRNLMRPGLVAGPELTADQIAAARASNLATRATRGRAPAP